MEMKALEVLIPIWTANTPPSNENENDYFLKIGVVSEESEESYFFVVIQWCAGEKKYFVEPVNVLPTGKLEPAEVHFSKQGILQFRAQIALLGIKTDKGFIDISRQKDWREQLADIHPDLVPQNIK